MTIQQHASFDSSAAELNATSKLVKAWESKNAKNAAKAGGISMMALSLAACGGSSTTTTATTTTTDTTTTDTTTTDTTTTVVAGVQKSLLSTTDLQTGGAGDDMFYGLNNGDFATGDIVDGGEGDDTLIAVYTSGDGATQAMRPVLTNVETIQLTITDGDAETTAATGDTTTLNLDQSAGVTNVIFGNKAYATDADTIVLSGVSTAVAVTIQDDAGDGSANANNYTMTYSDAATGTSDTAAVAVKMTTADGKLGKVTVANVETVTVSASGGFDASYALVADAATSITLNAAADSLSTDTNVGAVDLQSATVTSLTVNASNDVTVTDATTAAAKLFNVTANAVTATSEITLTSLTPTATATSDTFTVTATGAGTVVYTADNTDFGTQSTTNADSIVVNAVGNSGGVTVDLSAVTGSGEPDTLTVTGGTGDDTVIVDAASLDEKDTIALGGGTGDILQAAVAWTGNDAEDVFYDSDDSDTADDPTISGVEIASVILSDSTGTQAVDASSASFAGTLELLGDIDDAGTTINDITAGQTVKLGSSLDLTHGSAHLTLNVAGGTSSAPSASLVVTSDLLESASTAVANIDLLTADKVLDVDLTLASSDADVTTIKLDGASFAKATSVAISSAEKVEIGASDVIAAADGATLDFTGVTDTLSVAVGTSNDYTVKGSATAATTFTMAAGLDADDSLVGGSATTDTATVTATGLSATTGAITSTGVEVFDLTNTTTAVVDFTGTTGVTEVSINGLDATADVATLKGLDAGTEVTLGNGSVSHIGSLTVALEDAAGNADSLTLNLTSAGSGGLTNLTTAGIETLNIVGAANMNAQNISVLNSDASKIVVTGGNASPVALSLTGGANSGTASTVKLNAATTEVDASGYNAAISAIAATNTATSFSSKAAGSAFTGSVLADDFTIGTADAFVNHSSGLVIGTVDGGAGVDTLTAYVGKNASLNAVTNVETVNLVLKAEAADYTIKVLDGDVGGSTSNVPEGIQTATTLNLSGGEAGKLVTLAGEAGGDKIEDNGARTIDASAVLGSVAMVFDTNALVQSNLSDKIVISGGQGSLDKVTATLDASGSSSATTGEFVMSGVETLEVGSLTSSAGTGTNTVDLAKVTGLKNILLTDGAGTADAVTVSGIGSEVIKLGTGSDEFTGSATLTLTSVTGAADALDVHLVDTASTSSADTITADGVETINLTVIGDGTSSSGEDHKIAIANTNSNDATVNIIGTDDDTTLALTSIAASVTSVNATGFASTLTIAATARGSDAMTITGGTGADTIAMENAADVITGGAGTVSDDLHVTFSGTGGTVVVDLSSTTDQITLFNGVANSAAQTGFEDVDLSAYTQTGSLGADITGSTGVNVIVGTGYADTIRGGEGADTITGGNGDDSITTGSGADKIILSAVASNGTDTVTDFTSSTGGDKLDVTGLATFASLGILDDAATSTTGAITKTAADGTGGTDIANKLLFIDDAVTDLGAAIVSSGTDSKYDLASGKSAIIVYGDMAGTSVDLVVKHVVGGGSGAETITDIATLQGVDATAFIDANFIIA